MPLDWIDPSTLSFQSILLFERVQLSWFPGWPFPEPAMSLALESNPAVAWYISHKCPEAADWVETELIHARQARGKKHLTADDVRQVEVASLSVLIDLLVYAVDPIRYDRQPFLGWDSAELTGLVNFEGKLVLDIGAGTGRLAFTAAPLARVVWAVEPVGNLRDFLKAKARRMGCHNVYAVDGTITAIPFPDGFADIVMEGHVFGDYPAAEHAEMLRVTRPGGMIIHCPAGNDDAVHAFLVDHGFAWAVFEEPGEGPRWKYWKVV